MWNPNRLWYFLPGKWQAVWDWFLFLGEFLYFFLVTSPMFPCFFRGFGQPSPPGWLPEVEALMPFPAEMPWDLPVISPGAGRRRRGESSAAGAEPRGWKVSGEFLSTMISVGIRAKHMISASKQIRLLGFGHNKMILHGKVEIWAGHLLEFDQNRLNTEIWPWTSGICPSIDGHVQGRMRS